MRIENRASSSKTGHPSTQENTATTDESTMPYQPSQWVDTMAIATSTNVLPSDGIRDSPDYDYYRGSAWYKFLIVLLIAISAEIGIWTINFAILQGSIISTIFRPGASDFSTWIYVGFPLYSTLYILLAFLLEGLQVGSSNYSSIIRYSIGGVKLGVFVSMLFFITTWPVRLSLIPIGGLVQNLSILAGCYFIYILICIVNWIWRRST